MSKEDILLITMGLALLMIGFDTGLLLMAGSNTDLSSNIIRSMSEPMANIIATALIVLIIGFGGFALGIGLSLSDYPKE